MRNLKLLIEYDGSNYCGWQTQPNGLAIQQVIEQRLEHILNHPCSLIASGRTDAGVHALGQVANFNTEKTIPTRKVTAGLNALLPPDIAVIQTTEEASEFNSRRSAKAKTYLYRIYRRTAPSPFLHRRAWHLNWRLDLDKMSNALEMLVGERDFAGFRASDCCAKTTTRTIFDFNLEQKGDMLEIRLRSNGFLKFMVRNIIGTIVEVGRGKMELDVINEILASGDRRKAGQTAPPAGLYLLSVEY